MTLETLRSCRNDENFILNKKLTGSIGAKMKSWIAEPDFYSAMLVCHDSNPQFVYRRQSGKTKTLVLLVRHRNQRITIESTPFSPLWARSWPKLRIGSVKMTKLFFVITITSTRSYFMETNAFSIVSKNTCRKSMK